MPTGIYKRTVEMFASRRGKNPWNKGKKLGFTPKMAFKKGQKPWNKDKKTGQIVWNKGKRGVQVAWNKGLKTPEDVLKKMRVPHPHMIGEKNWNWNGGISSETVKIRGSAEYKLWRKSIFIRDNFTCQKYNTRGGDLVAHHINNFSDFSELRLAIDNGITLSEKAHKEFHKKYGKRNNTMEQLQEFIIN